MRLTGAITPTISANTNDWAPTGFDTTELILVASTGTWNLTGIANGSKGITKWLFVTSGNLVLKSESASSVAANRIVLSADATLEAGDGAIFTYDAVNSRWRPIVTRAKA